MGGGGGRLVWGICTFVTSKAGLTCKRGGLHEGGLSKEVLLYSVTHPSPLSLPTVNVTVL